MNKPPSDARPLSTASSNENYRSIHWSVVYEVHDAHFRITYALVLSASAQVALRLGVSLIWVDAVGGHGSSQIPPCDVGRADDERVQVKEKQQRRANSER